MLSNPSKLAWRTINREPGRDSFLLVRDFIATELHDDPLELLGEETWQAMLEVAEVYQKEKEESRKLMAESELAISFDSEGSARSYLPHLAAATCSNLWRTSTARSRPSAFRVEKSNLPSSMCRRH